LSILESGWGNAHAALDPLQTVDDDLVPSLQAGFNDPHISNLRAELNDFYCGYVIESDYSDLVNPLQLRNALLWNQKGVFSQLCDSTYACVLPRAQHIAWIGKFAANLNRASP
jgi:hypothetical protein